MKIKSVSNVDALNTQMSIAKVNDDDKKKQITVSSPGYRRKHSKLILRYNKFVNHNRKNRKDNNSSSEYESLIIGKRLP